MAQAGMHGLVGMLFRKGTAKRDWLLLGILLGSLIPDMDNVGVAIATLAKLPTEGIHRTLTHSLFFVLAVMLIFWLVGRGTGQQRWTNLGFGLGAGIFLHIILDLVLWFNGVEILWPISSWVNLWTNVSPPEWLLKFMEPAEFLFFGLYLWVLGKWARQYSTNRGFFKWHLFWMTLEFLLFLIFLPLVYLMNKGFLTVYGAVYLFSLFTVFFVTIRMRKTIIAAG